MILVQGVEPNMKWQQFVREILGLAAELDVQLVVTLGALLSDSPHTRPVPVTGSSTDLSLCDQMGIEASHYEGPTGIVGVIQEACTRFGIPGSCGSKLSDSATPRGSRTTPPPAARCASA